MTTNTDLANSALALLGEMPITAIGDTTSKPAVVCNRFADSARIEVLRLMHLTESTTIDLLDALQQEAVSCRLAARIAVPLLGSHEAQSKMEQLFAVRLQEAKTRILQSSALNGKILAMIGADLSKLDLSPTMLTEFVTTFQADATKEVLRLLHQTETTLYAAITDPLQLEAIDARHAAKIAAALTLPSTPALEELAAKRLQEAKVRILQSSALNGKILAMIGADLAKMDLSPTMLTEFVTTFQADATKEVLRLLHQTETTLYAALTDSLMLEAIDARHAAKIAAALTLPSTPALDELAAKRLQEARVRVLHNSAISGKILGMLGGEVAKHDLSPALLTLYGVTYADEALAEVLRMGRWSCATKRATLTAATAPTVGEYTYAYTLPGCCLRVLEVNGESVINSDEFFEIEGTTLLSNADTCWIRYVEHINFSACDPLLALAVTVRHAAKIAAALTLPSAPALEGLFMKRLAEARQADAQECGSRENPGWSRIFGRSRLMTSKVRNRNPLRLEDY